MEWEKTYDNDFCVFIQHDSIMKPSASDVNKNIMTRSTNLYNILLPLTDMRSQVDGNT